MIILRTDRLLLRPARKTDLDALHEILGNASAMRFWSTPPHTSRDDTRAWLATTMAIDPAVGEDFVVERDGQVIGKAGLYRFPEVGFVFHPAVWGHGIAAEALRPVLARAFAHHRLPAVEADVDPRNQASLRLLARLGFRETGRAERTWQVGAQWCDSVYLRLTPTARPED